MKQDIDFEIRRFFPEMDSILDDIKHKNLSPLSCLREFDGYWLLECDLPMVNKKDIKITFDENTVNVEAKLKEKYSQEKLGTVTKFEFFKKSITVPGKIDSKKSSAVFSKGRLEIKIPKKIEGHSIQIK